MSGWGFSVIGDPATQGSKRAWVNPTNGRAQMIEQTAPKIKTWRGDIKDAAPSGPCLDGPVAMHVVFTLRRPKSARKTDLAPCKTPDCDKLLRGLLDPIVQCGLLADDARVVEFTRLAKVWSGYDRDALNTPGVLVAAVEMVGNLWEIELDQFVFALRPKMDTLATM
jgi:Holliday junction resolvase RusA-like endonuclease